jgi:Flagellar basal body rod protein
VYKPLNQLQKVGRDLFTGQPQRAQNFRVMQGFLEGSNVNPILEMAKLIETHRAHEVYSKPNKGTGPNPREGN